MLNKLSFNGYLKIIGISLAIPLVATLVHMIYLIFHSSIRSSTGSIGYPIASLIPSLLWLLISLTIILFSLKKLYGIYLAVKTEKEKVSDLAEKEVEKQSKLVNNLSKLYNDLVEYDRQKTEFFSNITHELKTPLTIILGAMQLIEQINTRSQNDHQIRQLRHMLTIKQNCYRLLRLVNNILDITRLDSGYVKVNMTNCNLVYLVEEITQSVAPYTQQKNLLLEFDTDAEEINTAVDVDKIERIILNLLSNAIKFTPAGGKISVNMSLKNDKALITVKDTGTGIPSNMQNAIFERFRQLDNSLAKQRDGSGIGLSIVKSFVELHDGIIRVISDENKGSEFIVELPIRLIKSANVNNCAGPISGQSRIIESLNIEFSDIYTTAS